MRLGTAFTTFIAFGAGLLVGGGFGLKVIEGCAAQGVCYLDTKHAWRVTRWPEMDRPRVWRDFP